MNLDNPLHIIKKKILQFGGGPIFVHSDVMGSMNLIQKSTNSKVILKNHLENLKFFSLHTDIIIPTFNYQFPRKKIFDLKNDISELGPISENYRFKYSKWRSLVPIFNVCSNRKLLDETLSNQQKKIIDPFGKNSIFGYLYKRKGIILFYGARFDSFTGIHFIERATGGPLYRYDKIFTGKIKVNSEFSIQASLNYHVRPKGEIIDYCFNKIWTEILSNNLGYEYNAPLINIKILNFRNTVDYLLDKLSKDPFYLLTQPNKKYWLDFIDKLGRRVNILDMESYESGT